MYKKLLVGILISCCSGSPVLSQQSIEYYFQQKKAIELVSSGEIMEAQKILARIPEGMIFEKNWRILASCYYRIKEYRLAVKAYTSSIAFGDLPKAEGYYLVAKCYANLDISDSAFYYLELSLRNGYRYKNNIAAEPVFKNLDRLLMQRMLYPQMITSDTSRKTSWYTDLEFLKSEIKRLHFIFKQAPLPDEYLATEKYIKQNINSLNDEEIVVLLQKQMASLGDGHSLLYPFGMKKGLLGHLPVRFYQFSDGLYIIDGSGIYKKLIGKKILRIGDCDISTVYDKLSKYLSIDNPMGILWSAPAAYLIFPQFLKTAGIKTGLDSVSFTLGDGSIINIPSSYNKLDPSTILIKLKPFKTKNPILYLDRQNENYWFVPLNGMSTVYFQFNQVQNGGPLSLEKFASDLKKYLDSSRTRNLIIDVRHNNGGEGSILPAILKTIVSFSAASNDHRIYVITGRTTFSAAQQFISFIDKYLDVIFVGEPSSSKPTRAGDESSFLLPYSGVRGSIASGFYQFSSKDERIWISPEIKIGLSSLEYFRGEDPVMDAIQRLIQLQ